MHLQEFIDFAGGANRTPIGFYQAYPGLSVQDIHALVADSKSAGGRHLIVAYRPLVLCALARKPPQQGFCL